MDSDSELTSSSSFSDPLSLGPKTTEEGKLIKPHICTYPNCFAAFNRPWKLERHKTSHTNERPFKCTFEGCNKDYRSKSHLNRHTLTHSQIKISPIYLPCPVSDCVKTFMSKWSLKRHIRTHNTVESYYCTECNASFKKNRQLKKHLLIHAGTPPHSCSVCQKSFVCEAKLIRHFSKHRVYVCEYENCNIKCENWSALRKHLKLRHPKRFGCDLCQKTFSNKSTLQQHMLTHLPDDDKMIFQCTYEGCSRYYFYNRNLLQHIRTYHEGTRFKCDFDGCEQTLATKKKLQEHKDHHLNPKPRKSPKVLGERKPRCDKGIRKRSMAAILTGIDLPGDLLGHQIDVKC